MTDRPILYSPPMVRAILDDRKTQTRRIVKSPWKKREIVNLRYFYNDNGYTWSGEFDDPRSWGIPNIIDQDPLSIYDMACPYGRPGDRLWVRETWQVVRETLDYETGGEFDIYDWDGSIEEARKHLDGNARFGFKTGLYYAADGEDVNPCNFYDTIGLDGKVLAPREMVWRPSIHMPRWASRITLEITNVRVERLQDIDEQDAVAEGITESQIDTELQAAEAMDQVEPNPARCCFRYLWEDINGLASWDANPWVWVIEFKRVAG